MARSSSKPKNKPDPSAKKAQAPDHSASRDGVENQAEQGSSQVSDTVARGIRSVTDRIAGENAQFPAPSVMRTEDMQSLQRLYGNRAIGEMVQRWFWDDEEEEEEAEADGTPEDLRNFRDHGPFPASERGETITPTTGMGGFNARYDPDSMVLTITVNIGFNFIDGMTIAGNTVTANESSMDNMADRINAHVASLPAADRAAFMARIQNAYQWTGAADPRITTWMADYKANVEGAWSSAGTGISFQGSREGWDEQLASVNVVVNTTNITSLAPGAAIPGPQPVHCQSDIYKTPEQDVFGAYVEPGTAASGTDQRLVMGSGQVYEGGQSHLLTQQVYFDNNSAILNADATDMLDQMVISFQAPAGTTGTTINITGRASTTGEDSEEGRQRNIELAQRRAEAVATYLRTTVVEGRNLENVNWRIHSITGEGTAGATEGAGWRRVDVVFAGGEGQNIAAHEFGHMIGLGDEYASTPERDALGNVVTDAEGNPISRGLISGTGGDVGEATEHDQLGRDMGVGGSVYENNDNMMSLGSTIRPQHYATFMKALHEVTNITDWQLRR